MRIAPSAIGDMTEREWTRNVRELGQMLGWHLRYHTWRSKHSAAGFPDEFWLRGSRAVALELKTERGKLSDDQKEWLRGLVEAGIETYVVRPRHLQQLADVLASPIRFDSALAIETEKEINA